MSQESIEERISDERKRIKQERKTMVKDAIIAVIASAILAAFLLIWKGQITGFQVADEDAFCTDRAGFMFLSPENITLPEEDGSTYQIRMSCPEGNITLQDNSQFIDVSTDGKISLRKNTESPDRFNAIIIAEDEAGTSIYEKFNFEIK